MYKLSAVFATILLVGCSSSESTVTPITPNEPPVTECVETKSMEYNSYTGELKDVPCEAPAAVQGEETPPDEPPTE